MSWSDDFQYQYADLPADDAKTTVAPKAADDEYMYPGARELAVFHDWYQQYHGYLASIVCVFGIIANALNIVVLTRRNMISATNCILTGLAVSDGLTMAAYLPFALRFYVLYGTEASPTRNSLPAVRFMLFFACFSVVVHTVSIWLTVVLAVFRYLFIRYPRHGAIWCSVGRAKLSIVLVNFVTLIVCIPNFVTMTLKSYSVNVTDTDTTHNSSFTQVQLIWNVGFKEDTAVDVFIQSFNFWIQALFVRLVPCIGLTVLSLLLVQTMRQAEERRQNLRGKSSVASKSGKEGAGGSDRKTNRTTLMLLLVVILFLVTELPQGVINLLSGLLPGFVNEIYMALGDLLDILALINNGINFILYCSMSKQFRDTFVSVFRLDAVSRLCARCCCCYKPQTNSLEDSAPITVAPTVVVGGKDQYALVAQA